MCKSRIGRLQTVLDFERVRRTAEHITDRTNKALLRLFSWFPMVSTLAIIISISAHIAQAHPGGLDGLGCHHDWTRGGYHCHSGELAGGYFQSYSEALQALNDLRNRPSSEVSPSNLTSENPSWNEAQSAWFFEELLASSVEELNEIFELPREIELAWETCGQANAFYESPGRIVFCKELIDAIVPGELGGEEVLRAVSSLLFILFHEFGHLLIDLLELPITGREEDAVDQLATLFFEEEPVLAMHAATFWLNYANRQRGRFVPMESFADEHGLDEQRFYNIACWTYGADPLVRGYVAQRLGLPEERAPLCEGEYRRMKSGWEQLLEKHLKNPLISKPGRNASGYWRFVEEMHDSDEQIRCTASGTLELWQIETRIFGASEQTGSCVIFGIPIESNAPATISTGEVTATGVTFDVAHCSYHGSFEDDERTVLSGSLTCTEEIGEHTIEITGTWHAVR